MPETDPSPSAPSTSGEHSNGALNSAAAEERTENRDLENDRFRVGEYNRVFDDFPRFTQPAAEMRNGGITFRGHLVSFDDVAGIRDDTWSCVIVVLTFWFFVSMTLILGVYGSTNMRLGPNASILLQPNPFFVQSVKVTEMTEMNPGLMLYGFYETPPLDVYTTWSETYTVSVPSDSHKEYIHYLNKGSQINISYRVKSVGSSVFIVIAQGNDGLAQWLENPTYPNTTLSWNIVRGTGSIQQDIYTSSSYFVALGNLYPEEVEVQINLTINAMQYNTSNAYTMCTFSHGSCSMDIHFEGNAILLTTPIEQAADSDGYVKITYGPRWLTYCIGIGGMTVLMIIAFHFLNKYRCTNEDDTRDSQVGFDSSARDPLLTNKDDDISSWGSSYDSASNDEEDIQEFLATYSIEGKPYKEVDHEGNNTRRLCAICYDAPRDCFFLPCGHCVACFDCSTRIAEAAGTCPICRRNMKKVRKIFTV